MALVRASVRSVFHAFSVRYEGRIDHFYLDVRKYVTIAVGALVDPIELALPLTMVRASDGQPATRDEIRADWHAVKARTDLAKKGAAFYRPLCKLRLTLAGIEALTEQRFDENIGYIVQDFPAYPTWPADVQLAVISLAWAVGAGFKKEFPKFSAALRAGDFVTAATECNIRSDDPTTGEVVNPGVIPRNKKNRALLLAGAEVVRRGLDPDQLWVDRLPAEPPPPPPGPWPGDEPPTPPTPRVVDPLPLVWHTSNQSVNEGLREAFRGRDGDDEPPSS